MSWTDDRVQQLKALWTEGRSASQIARALNADGGESITRNAVIGKVTRLGLNASGRKPGPKVARVGAYTRPRIVREQPIPEKAPPPFLTPDGVPYTTLTIPYLGACKFPYDKPDVEGGYIYCGHATDSGETYCGFHRSRCYTARGEKLERAKRASSQYWNFSMGKAA